MDLTDEQWVVVSPLKGMFWPPRLTVMTGRMDRYGAILADVPSRRRRRRGTPKTRRSVVVPHLHTPVLVRSTETRRKSP